jgi:hypothetical protein
VRDRTQKEGRSVTRQEQVLRSTKTIATMLALGAALTISAAGCVVRGQAEGQGAPISDSPRNPNPGLGQHRLDSMDASDPESTPQIGTALHITIPESTHRVNPAIGQHRIDAYELERP